MHAALVTRYGPPENVRVAEIPVPQVGPGRVLVRVNAAAVTSADARIRAARFPRGFGILGRMALGMQGPRQPILGSAFSGAIAGLGKGVQGFAVGDPVCGMTGARMGAHAEYLTASQNQLVIRPTHVSDEEAAGVLFGGLTALHFLRDRINLKPGMSILVVGASGAVGTNAVQIARLLGAKVTAVTSFRNMALLESLGVSEVIDYTRKDLARLGRRFDIVLDATGCLSVSAGRGLVTGDGQLALMVADLATTLGLHGRVVVGPASERACNGAELLGMVAKGNLSVVNSGTVPLTDIVCAHQMVDSGRKVGNIIVYPGVSR